MGLLRQYFDQAWTAWQQLRLASRVALVAGLVGLVGLVTAVGLWSARPEFIPLATGLAPTEAAEIVSKLQANGIAHQLNFSGSAVLVPKSAWNRARLFVDEAGAAGAADSWSDTMLGDPEMSRQKWVRRREESLARTLQRMSGVAHATVHIAAAEPSPFVQQQRPATASVVLELRSGSPFTREQAAAVVALVAGSIEGLEPDNVSLLDARGRLLSPQAGSADADMAGQFEFRRRIETELAARATSMLAQLLGEGRSMVRVSADIDFTRLERTETKYDPENKVPSEENISTIQETKEAETVGGAAGTASNLNPGARRLSAASPYKKTEETVSTKFQNAETVDVVKQLPGKISRLTVAVMADLSALAAPVPADPQAPADPAVAKVTKENVEAIVKQAVGFDKLRGDEIEVLITQFVGPGEDQQEQVLVQQWQFYTDLARNASLGLASLVALLLGLLTLRKMKPVTVEVPVPAEAADGEELRSHLSERVRQHPDEIKDILSVWLAEEEPAEPAARAA